MKLSCSDNHNTAEPFAQIQISPDTDLYMETQLLDIYFPVE